MCDLFVHNHGSIFVLEPVSKAGFDWLDEHIAEEHQIWGNGIVVEHRYIDAIVDGALADGLEVR